MKERGILFKGEMVRAVLDGTKTQTRRVVKPQPPEHHEAPHLRSDGVWATTDNNPPHTLYDYPMRCPYGVPGDQLWVREAWRTGKALDHLSPATIEEQAAEAGYRAGPRHPACPIHFEADGSVLTWGDADDRDFGTRGKLRPSIHMPRWASRIDLEVTAVRVERVQEITAADALAEGVDPGCGTCGELSLPNGCGCDNPEPLPQDAFLYLWDTINAKRGYSWESNPWVWVVEYRRLVANRDRSKDYD